MEDRCPAEVRELHAFFEAWFTGRLEDTDAAFERFADVVGDRFEMITPEGHRVARAELLAGLRAAHGSRPAHGFRIWIERPRAQPVSESLAVVTYEEWQQAGDEVRGRLSTALFRERAGTPHGVEWVHVHETWLPGQAGAADRTS